MKLNLTECIPQGKENAVTAAELAKLFECTERDITREINRLRKDGKIICSCGSGYFLPSDDYDIKKFVRQMKSRITDINNATKSAEDYLTERGGNNAENAND